MIKVIIQRVIADGMESTYDNAVKNTLRAILEADGYISGASYKDASNKNHRIIITNWQNVEAWNNWANSQARQDVIGSIQPILEQQEKITVLTA
ncbi:MAG: antibiotic biosynthesis monooxygenase [Saccharospirillaceae bacterium]|jgi:heme-degrading monooxygenase HmoA|nr:antibiotic biosynthesis monooxygenase [Thalassolituus sp. HI0120]KZZ46106.1 antibiotic biosynthesis monooxygenase [Thalassolituus sp. HI0120]MCH2040151.1 antibiotic biosynthesis monooxygenase [Saccharospirillaceae bacterium]